MKLKFVDGQFIDLSKLKLLAGTGYNKNVSPHEVTNLTGHDKGVDNDTRICYEYGAKLYLLHGPAVAADNTQVKILSKHNFKRALCEPDTTRQKSRPAEPTESIDDKRKRALAALSKTL